VTANREPVTSQIRAVWIALAAAGELAAPVTVGR